MTAAGAAPDPSRTLAVLFGASRWPEFDGLDHPSAGLTYAAAADEIRAYLLSEEGFGLPRDNLLDLFDSSAAMAEQDKRIREFILKKCKETATIQDVVIVYIGHGSTMQGNKFIFILKSTSRDQRDITSYKSETLGQTLKKSAPRLRKWIILDCCAAQAAYGDFQPASEPAKVLEDEALDAFPPEGAAFYAACSSDNFAYNDVHTGSRMFTAALIKALRKGDPKLGEHLTLSEVAMLTRAEINRQYGPEGVRPYIGDPDQRKGELTMIPFFPNPARREIGVKAQLSALQDSISALQRRFDERLDEANRALEEQKARNDALALQVADQARQGPGPDQPEARSGTYSLYDIDPRLATLPVDEQRWWDKARGGHILSSYILFWSASLLAAAIGLAAILLLGFLRPNQSGAYAGGASLLGVASFLTLILASLGARNSTEDRAIPAPSPELEALLRTNSVFRNVYCADYQPSPLGLLLRRAMIFASIFSALAAILATFLIFTVVGGGLAGL
jgi:hypothetical protein